MSKAKLSKVSATSQVKVTKINYLRKSIARLLSLINLQRKKKSIKKYITKKQKPLDMRPKLTRAIRKKLTPHQKNLKTIKAIKKIQANPVRKYAIKAK